MWKILDAVYPVRWLLDISAIILSVPPIFSVKISHSFLVEKSFHNLEVDFVRLPFLSMATRPCCCPDIDKHLIEEIISVLLLNFLNKICKPSIHIFGSDSDTPGGLLLITPFNVP